jgi:hypothetical protein
LIRATGSRILGAIAMSVYKQKGSKNWWYKFTWRGRQIRESTKQPNKRVAEQIEAAHKAGLAKAEVGIREKKPVPTLREFIDNDFAPFVESRFANKAKTLEYYRIGLKNLREFEPLANSLLDAITGDKIAAFIAKRRQAGLAIASINRQLESPAANAEARCRMGQGREAVAQGRDAER